MCCFDTHSNFVKKRFFETSKPNFQETAQILEKLVLQKCLRINFYTYIPVNLYRYIIFFKNITIAVP
jgi:hypothetical protein